MEELLHVLWRSAFQAHRLRHAYPSTSCPVTVATLRSAFQAPSRKNEFGRPFRTALSIYSNRKQTLSVFHALRRALFPRLQFLRFCFFGNFESLGKYNADGHAKNFKAAKKNDFVSSN